MFNIKKILITGNQSCVAVSEGGAVHLQSADPVEQVFFYVLR